MGKSELEELLSDIEKEKRQRVLRDKSLVKNFYIRNDGEYIFRLFMNIKNPKLSPYYRTFFHLGFKLPNNKKRFPFTCLGKKCPLCSHYYRVQNKGGSWQFKAVERFLYYGINAKGEIIQASFPKKINDVIIKAIRDEIKNYKYNPLSIENGCFIKLRKDTNSRDGIRFPVYKVVILKKASKPLSPPLMDKLKTLPALKNIHKRFTQRDYLDVLRGKNINYKTNQTQSGPKEVFKSRDNSKDKELSLSEMMENKK